MAQHCATEEEVKQVLDRATEQKVTVFVKWGASWCGPCKMIAPTFDKLARACQHCVFLSLDTDELQEMAMTGKVSSIPAFWVVQGGSIVHSFKGADQSTLTAVVKRYATTQTTPKEPVKQ